MGIKVDHVRGYEVLDSRGNLPLKLKYCFQTEASA